MSLEDFEQVNLRMPKSLLREIDLLVETKMTTRSQIIREGTKKGLELIK